MGYAYRGEPASYGRFSPFWGPFARPCAGVSGRLRRGERGDLLLHLLGLHRVAVHSELLRLEPEREADELREVQHGHAKVALHEALRLVLLQVQVQVAERTRGDHAVGVGVDRVADVR